MEDVIPAYINATGVFLLGLAPALLAIHKIIQVERQRRSIANSSTIEKPKPWWKKLGFDDWFFLIRGLVHTAGIIIAGNFLLQLMHVKEPLTTGSAAIIAFYSVILAYCSFSPLKP